MSSISELLTDAIAHHQAGRLHAAEQIYRQVLAAEPDQADALHLLGVIAFQVGKHDVAVAYLARAIARNGTMAAFHNDLGIVLQTQGKLDEAVASYRRALELAPDYAEAHNNLGNVFKDRGRLDEAAACYRRAIELAPEFAEAHNSLGAVLQVQGKLGDAVACYRRALEVRPGYAQAQNNLGAAMQRLGKLDEAVASYRRAVEWAPGDAQAHNNLGTALESLGKLDEALACYRRAIELAPEAAQAHNNLGNLFKDQGNLDEAIACYRRAVELKPDDAEAQSNLVYTLSFCDNRSEALGEELRRYSHRHAEPLADAIKPHTNERSQGRRLRIGYVSPDLRLHPVGRFLLPLLESHDHQSFEVFAYSSVSVPDALTWRCRAAVNVWREVVGLSDERLAEVIRQDGIDILVDLSMHMARNRLRLFARKPAPVQVTYLAYCGTTGLRAIDFRLTDPHMDPPQTARDYSEKSIWLPETYWCYRPVDQTPPVGPAPALTTGSVTFGCLNNFCKVTARTLATWTCLLQAVPRSRLVLHSHAGSHRDRLRESLAREGVSPERVGFAPMRPTADYFRSYHELDVALDPFPYGGGTTTCDALWMGVPVVTLAGSTAVGRGGLSILVNLGLTELVAQTPEQYVQIAVELSGDLPRLSEIRSTLRSRMENSPLMDAPRFARNVETAYRRMWQQWCSGGVG